MANGRYESVSTFALPDAYQQQAAEARRRRRMAEMLAQQAYQPGDIQNAPIPAAAPLVQGLQAYLAARAARKSDEAEESAKETASREAREFLNTLTRPREDFDKTMDLKEVLQIGTPELVDGQLKYPDTFTAAPNLQMIPQAGPQVQLGRKPEDDQVYMPAPVSRFTATGRETDPKRMAAMLANPQFKSGFTDEQLLEQRRNLALEGMLTSENPLVQKVAGAIYPTLQPEKAKLQLGNIDPAKFTPASIAAALKSGDVGDLVTISKPVDRIGKPSPGDFTRASLARFNETGNYNDLVEKPKPVSGGGADRGQLYKVTGPDGKIKYVTRDEAIGMSPAPTSTGQKTGGPTGDSSVDRRQYRTSKRELQNSYTAVNDFLQALKTTPKEESLVGEKAGALSTKYKLALSAVRVLQNTGVINVGELPFLEDALRDPQKISQLFNPGSRETITGQINALADLLEAQSTTLDESYGYDVAPLRGSETRRANRVPAAAAAAGITQEEWDNSTAEERKPWL